MVITASSSSLWRNIGNDETLTVYCYCIYEGAWGKVNVILLLFGLWGKNNWKLAEPPTHVSQLEVVNAPHEAGAGLLSFFNALIININVTIITMLWKNLKKVWQIDNFRRCIIIHYLQLYGQRPSPYVLSMHELWVGMMTLYLPAVVGSGK